MSALVCILGIGAIVGGGFLGYIGSKWSKSDDLSVRFIGIGIIMMLVIGSALMEFSGGGERGSSRVSSPDFALISPSSHLDLSLNETVTQTLSANNLLTMTYDGELGEVISLQVTPPEGVRLASIIMLHTPHGETTPQMLGTTISSSDPTLICGMRLEDNGLYAFGFTAPQSGTYTITFERGDTCD